MDLVHCSRVILLGDLNYRVSLPEETTRLLVDKREWSTLLENDQVGNQTKLTRPSNCGLFLRNDLLFIGLRCLT